MSDYYHNFLSSLSGLGGSQHQQPNPQDAMPGPPSFSMGHSLLNTFGQNMAYFPGLPEQVMLQTPKAQRNRRKSAPGPDHIKHRRTRSGCFTCRLRRVKCDETRPICERCRKGKRDCVYPEPPPSKSSSSSSQAPKEEEESTLPTSPSSSNEEGEDDLEQDTKLSPIPDKDEALSPIISQQQPQPAKSLRHMSSASSSNLKRFTTRTRRSSETPSRDGTKSSSPTVSSTATVNTCTPASFHLPDELVVETKPDWTHVSREIRFYLDYFYENITHYHYGIHKDFSNFFRTTFISLALGHEPLLYAVVAFSAFHRALRDSHGTIEAFLEYYNKTVATLLDVLFGPQKDNSLGTLLTILQLATIEEYLGDWANLRGHQKAALEILMRLYTPQPMVQTSLGRTILAWYTRFDIFVGLMGGFPTSLPRDWFVTLGEYCRIQLAKDPDNLDWLYEDAENRLWLICVDLCSLAAKRASGELAEVAFLAGHDKISSRLRAWKETLDPAVTDPARLSKPSDMSNPGGSNRIFNAFSTDVPLYEKPLSSTTVMICEWHSIVMMNLCQTIEDTQPPAPWGLSDLYNHSQAICQIFEAAERYPSVPNGFLFMFHPSVAIAALFLPKSPRHNWWLRQKFALLESLGCNFPLPQRKRLAELLEDETAVRWWFPNDQGFSPILQSMRASADERNAAAVSAKDGTPLNCIAAKTAMVSQTRWWQDQLRKEREREG